MRLTSQTLTPAAKWNQQPDLTRWDTTPAKWRERMAEWNAAMRAADQAKAEAAAAAAKKERIRQAQIAGGRKGGLLGGRKGGLIRAAQLRAQRDHSPFDSCVSGDENPPSAVE